MFQYVGMYKCFQTDTRFYFPLFDVVCYKCCVDRFNDVIKMGWCSNYYDTRTPIPCMKLYDLRNYMEKICRKDFWERQG